MTTLRHEHVTYDYGGRSLTLMYPPDAMGIWEVYEGVNYLGVVVETYVHRRERYTPRPSGRYGPGRQVMTEDWRHAVIYLIEAA